MIDRKPVMYSSGDWINWKYKNTENYEHHRFKVKTALNVTTYCCIIYMKNKVDQQNTVEVCFAAFYFSKWLI